MTDHERGWRQAYKDISEQCGVFVCNVPYPGDLLAGNEQRGAAVSATHATETGTQEQPAPHQKAAGQVQEAAGSAGTPERSEPVSAAPSAVEEAWKHFNSRVIGRDRDYGPFTNADWQAATVLYNELDAMREEIKMLGTAASVMLEAGLDSNRDFTGQREVALRCAWFVENHYWDSLNYADIGKAHGRGIAKAIRAYATTLPADEGSVRVPVEPTDNMLAAINSYAGDDEDDWRTSSMTKYRNLLAAAKERT